MSFGTHVPKHQDTSPDIIKSEKLAILVGVVLSIAGLFAAVSGLREISNVIGQLILLLVAGYVAAIALQFWVAKLYVNGMTTKEIIAAVVWPLDMVRSIRLGLRAMQGKSAGSYRVSDDQGHKVLDEEQAKIAGAIVAFVALFLTGIGVFVAFSVLWSVLWLALVVWGVGAIVFFWVAKAWEDGLTVKELTLAVLWPADLIRTIRAGVKAFVES